MAKFTLDNIRQAAQAKYGSTDIELDDGFTVKLLNPLRLTKARRTELQGLQARLEEEGADQEEILYATVRLVAQNEHAAERLSADVGEDLTVLVEIFRNYSEGTHAGEASASQA